MTDCPFCRIAAGRDSTTLVRDWGDVYAIRPRSGGVHPGHLLVIPRRHVADVGEDPATAAAVMLHAAELVAELPAANVISSKQGPATQTVFHLHVHVVPRTLGDGLALPWTPQQRIRGGSDYDKPISSTSSTRDAG